MYSADYSADIFSLSMFSITLYVRRVIVQEKTVEVYLNPIPTMSYLTNLEEFMTKFLEDESYSNLERLEVWRETLNATGKQKQI